MKETEIRKVRGYKVTDKVYSKALKRGQREKMPLATLLEKVVTAYANGWNLSTYGESPDLSASLNQKGK